MVNEFKSTTLVRAALLRGSLTRAILYWSVTVVGQPARLEPVGGERVPALGDYPPTQFPNSTTAPRGQGPVTRVTNCNWYAECTQKFG